MARIRVGTGWPFTFDTFAVKVFCETAETGTAAVGFGSFAPQHGAAGGSLGVAITTIWHLIAKIKGWPNGQPLYLITKTRDN